MKRILALLLILTLLMTACAQSEQTKSTQSSSIDNAELLLYLEEQIKTQMSLDNDEYEILDVTAKYISKEYLEELDYNSKANVFFGYTLEEMNETFEGTRYIFTPGEDNRTVVKEMEMLEDDTTGELIANIAIGVCVIAICVTVGVYAPSALAPIITTCINLTVDDASLLRTYSGPIGDMTEGVVDLVSTGDPYQLVGTAFSVLAENVRWSAVAGYAKSAFGK